MVKKSINPILKNQSFHSIVFIRILVETDKSHLAKAIIFADDGILTYGFLDNMNHRTNLGYLYELEQVRNSKVPESDLIKYITNILIEYCKN